MLSSTEMEGEENIIHNNAHSVIWKEPGDCMFVIKLPLNGLTCRLFSCLYHMHICIHVYSNYNVVCLDMHCMNSTLLALSIKCHCVHVVSKSGISEPSYLGTHT